MNGDESIKNVNKINQIKILIKEKNFINCFIIGHSADDDFLTIK